MSICSRAKKHCVQFLRLLLMCLTVLAHSRASAFALTLTANRPGLNALPLRLGIQPSGKKVNVSASKLGLILTLHHLLPPPAHLWDEVSRRIEIGALRQRDITCHARVTAMGVGSRPTCSSHTWALREHLGSRFRVQTRLVQNFLHYLVKTCSLGTLQSHCHDLRRQLTLQLI
jgi:hypothetical protein